MVQGLKLSFHHRGYRFDPWSGNKEHGQKIYIYIYKKVKKIYLGMYLIEPNISKILQFKHVVNIKVTEILDMASCTESSESSIDLTFMAHVHLYRPYLRVQQPQWPMAIILHNPALLCYFFFFFCLALQLAGS